MIVDEAIKDIGSGLNYNRKQWNRLIVECMENKIDNIIITHKDRFVRFGYSWFESFLSKYNVKIIVVNNELLSPQEELVQDIISILHVFSCRIYGLRKYKKKIKEDEEIKEGRKVIAIKFIVKNNEATIAKKQNEKNFFDTDDEFFDSLYVNLDLGKD
jgi:putative resolvase